MLPTTWPLIWTHGRGQVQALGGMLGPVDFVLDSGQTVQPFAVFPWADETPPAGEPPLEGLLSRGRGEWPCVPFGVNPDPHQLHWHHPAHGESSHGLWSRVDNHGNPAHLRLRFNCPDDSPISHLERHITGVVGQPSIECRLIVHARRSCRLPLGLHPTLRLPSRLGALRLEPGAYKFAHSFPTEVEPGADILESNQVFTSLSNAPRRGGGSVNLRGFPLVENTESLVQLCGIDGHMQAHNVDEGYTFHLHWDAGQLPSCLLWISNAGRSAWPWSRRHYALGMEPVCANFDLGVAASVATNSISRRGVATHLKLKAGTPFIVDYVLGVKSSSNIKI